MFVIRTRLIDSEYVLLGKAQEATDRGHGPGSSNNHWHGLVLGLNYADTSQISLTIYY